jgi:hypothetical protein
MIVGEFFALIHLGRPRKTINHLAGQLTDNELAFYTFYISLGQLEMALNSIISFCFCRES